MKKIIDKNIGHLTVEVYEGNTVIKITHAIVKITGHYVPSGHFQRPVSFTEKTGLNGVIQFRNIPLDMYKVEVSKRAYGSAILKEVSVQVPGEDPIGHFTKPSNLAKLRISYAKNTWDKITDERILTLHENVQSHATAFINEVEDKLGIKLRVTDALRTDDKQNSLYAQGRTKPGLIVTGAKAGESYHNYGLAIDVVEITNSGDVNYSTNWSAIEKIGVNNGFSWGGSWSKPDKPHFQMNFGLSIKQLQRGSRP